MPQILVLWDVDYTLVAADGVGRRLYQGALRELYGLDLPVTQAVFAGRTDSAIALEVLAAAGVPNPAAELGALHAYLAERAAGVADEVRKRGRILPGAAQALAALAGREVVQSLLTGNIPELARVKLSALDLTEHLDLSIGAYGDVSAIRADLVAVARSKAGARHGTDFGGRATVLVGDTPSDVEAALTTGASAVGVATGSFSAAELAAAGAHVVLPDLADTPAVVAAILGAPAVPSRAG
ncbi:MAG TPA: haloacid dehalogenase-like hydrolase [Streptosporangiaceae bacterium]|nr:haloacid dehalogenase-like hydrolase [Streptosporangiaceae bacterium]